jgi:hypothetical protein
LLDEGCEGLRVHSVRTTRYPVLFWLASDDHLSGAANEIEHLAREPEQVIRAYLAEQADRFLWIELHHLGEGKHSGLADLRVSIAEKLVYRKVDLITQLDLRREILTENNVSVLADKFIRVRGVLSDVVHSALREIEFDLGP